MEKNKSYGESIDQFLKDFSEITIVTLLVCIYSYRNGLPNKKIQQEVISEAVDIARAIIKQSNKEEDE